MIKITSYLFREIEIQEINYREETYLARQIAPKSVKKTMCIVQLSGQLAIILNYYYFGFLKGFFKDSFGDISKTAYHLGLRSVVAFQQATTRAGPHVDQRALTVVLSQITFPGNSRFDRRGSLNVAYNQNLRRSSYTP